MKRRQDISSKQEWESMLSDLDGDTQWKLSEELECFEERSNVNYTVNSLGRIDSESSPFYTDEEERSTE